MNSIIVCQTSLERVTRMCHVFRVCSQQCSSPSISGDVEVRVIPDCLDSAGFDILDCSSSRRVVWHHCRIYSKVWLKTEESCLLPTTRYIIPIRWGIPCNSMREFNVI